MKIIRNMSDLEISEEIQSLRFKQKQVDERLSALLFDAEVRQRRQVRINEIIRKARNLHEWPYESEFIKMIIDEYPLADDDQVAMDAAQRVAYS